MDEMYDIIPPAPVHGGLTGMLTEGAGPMPCGLALAALLLLLLLTAWLLRRRLIARLRLGRARRLLRQGRADALERLLRKSWGLAHLHAARPPAGVPPGPWRELVEGLHAARFGRRPLESATVQAALRRLLSPPPLRERGWGRGGTRP